MILVYVANGHYGTKPAARSRNIAACGGASSNPGTSHPKLISAGKERLK